MQQLRCQECHRVLNPAEPHWRCPCGGVLDLDFTPRFDRAAIASRPWDLWRYREALPVAAGAEVSLGEGCTPLVPLTVPMHGGREVLVKQEQLFPTGSFKDRGAAVLVSKLRELGLSEVVEDSSGNAGAAVAAYCARAGIGCRILAPASTSAAKLAQIGLYGAELVRVPGDREATARAALEAAEHLFYASHAWSPYFFHGTKTFAFELAEQLGWTAPEALVLPAGNGTLLLGAWLGFRELLQAGMVGRMPRLVAVQSAACAPLAQAFAMGSREPAEVQASPTLAEGIAVARPARGRQMLAAVAESGGSFLTVNDDEIRQALRLAARQGFCVEPTAAAALAGTLRYLGEIENTEGKKRQATLTTVDVVTVFTGHGLKAADKLATLM